WLRDAALEGHLPSIEDMTNDPYIFPYRYGHALWAYIGEKWGDEVIGEILQTSVTSGLEPAFKRATGRSLEDLSNDWRDAIQTTFLPQLGDHYRARRIAQPTLTQRHSRGRLFLAPALSPDGKKLAFFGDEGGFFVDLWLADGETGHVLKRLVKSTQNNNYESLRFINSAGSFSPDGRYFAMAAKRKDRDDLVILDVKKDKEERRISVPLSAIQTPHWSPDGQQLVFTGFSGGFTDLFMINRDGTGLRRLTDDKFADLQPSWSPDGRTIAFVTDRGPGTGFDLLRFGNLLSAPSLFEEVSSANPNTMGGTTTPSAGPPDASAPMSIYRSPSGFRPSAEPDPAGEQTTPPPVTVRALLDSATLALPDTTEFTFRPYKVRFTADYVVRPTVGYQRDNFGRGVFGGTAIALSDILGNHSVVLAGSINGRISEAQVLGLYVNQSRRLNWAGGFSQDPFYFYGGSDWTRIEKPGSPGDSLD